MNIIDKINAKQINPNVPEFRVGDTVRVDVKIIEGKRERIQAFEGVVVARRGGLSATFDELNKYFTIAGMPVASSQYWNSIHGSQLGEAQSDAEGLQTMRTLARNMAFLVKSIALGKEKFGLPEKESRVVTNFIR